MKIDIRRIIATAFVVFLAVAASAQDVSEQEARKARLEREIALIDRQLSENTSRSSDVLAELTLIRKKISNRNELVTQSNRQIRKLDDDIYLTQLQINKMKKRVDELKDGYAKLIRGAYKNRDARVWYMYMLASDNLGQAFRRFGYFKNMSTQMKDEAQKIREAQEELEKEREKLKQMKAEAQKVKDKRVRELEELRKDEAKAKGVVNQLNKNKKKYQSQLKSKRKEIEALNREIERLISAAVSSKGSTSSKKKTEVDVKLAAEFAKNKGKLPWPADGPVVGSFGVHYHPVYKNLRLPPNNGCDIAMDKGGSVKSVFDGVVTQVMVIPGFNQCVMVDHGNYFTLYCKLKSVDVKTGDKIKTGESLGTIDTINGQTQLHFELWQGKNPQNPVNWLR